MYDYDTIARGLLRLTNWFSNYNIWFCGMGSSMEASFEESYAIRALLHTERVLGIGHIQNVAHNYCNLMLRLQGAHWENMFDMGYGYELDENGMINCSCVADNASVARAIIDTVKAYPEYPKNQAYIDGVRKYIDYVLSHYITENGVIGVGVLDYKVNPIPEYWCANGLFSQVLVCFAELTGETKYFDAAVAPMEYLATFDYKNTEWKEWNISPQMMILYTGEGIIEGLSNPVMKKKLDVPLRAVTMTSIPVEIVDNANAIQQAANRVKADMDLPEADCRGDTICSALHRRWDVWTDWLNKNQDACGLWKSPAGQDYRDYEPGLSWLIARAYDEIHPDQLLDKAIGRQLNYLTTQEPKSYFGLYCRAFSTSLAYLSFASIAEKCMKKDPDGFEKAIAQAMKNSADLLW